MKLIALLGALVLLASPAMAADGDTCTGAQATYTTGTCKLLCDSDTGDTSCADMRIPHNAKGQITIELQDDCSACAVDVNWTSTSGGVEHDIVTLNCTGTTAHTIDSGVRIPGWLTATISGTSGCTDLDVLTHFEGN